MNDLISRKELLDPLNRLIAEFDGTFPIVDMLLTIRNAVERMPSVNTSCVEWHEVCTRPLTDEECAYYKDIGIEAEDIFDCEMPDDGQEILIATEYGVDKDICSNDAEYGIGLEGHGDWDGVLAWAAMPKYNDLTELK